MKKGFSRWDAAEHLNTKEDMQLYLEACVEEDEGDGAMIRAALGDIAKTENMRELAKKAGVSREGLYKALSEKGNPSFALILKFVTTQHPSILFSVKREMHQRCDGHTETRRHKE